MINLNADLSGVAGYIGSVGGILDAVQSPAYQGDFIGHMMTELRDRFMVDSIAANESGYANIAHVFEWPRQSGSGVSLGEPSNIPLFKLTKKGQGGTRYLSYSFLPSTRPVPLPDPARYGFKPEKLKYLSRHIFKFKAIVMEADSAVTIEPRNAKRLFIPDERNKYGYYMTSRPQVINPGGWNATGGFTAWWTLWFDTRAQGYVHEQTLLAEEFIKSTGQSIIRDATTGRFARGTNVSFGYVDAAQRTAKAKMLAAAEEYYPEDEF